MYCAVYFVVAEVRGIICGVKGTTSVFSELFCQKLGTIESFRVADIFVHGFISRRFYSVAAFGRL